MNTAPPSRLRFNSRGISPWPYHPTAYDLQLPRRPRRRCTGGAYDLMRTTGEGLVFRGPDHPVRRDGWPEPWCEGHHPHRCDRDRRHQLRTVALMAFEELLAACLGNTWGAIPSTVPGVEPRRCLRRVGLTRPFTIEKRFTLTSTPTYSYHLFTGLHGRYPEPVDHAQRADHRVVGLRRSAATMPHRRRERFQLHKRRHIPRHDRTVGHRDRTAVASRDRQHHRLTRLGHPWHGWPIAASPGSTST